jgi:hypothetical protein
MRHVVQTRRRQAGVSVAYRPSFGLLIALGLLGSLPSHRALADIVALMVGPDDVKRSGATGTQGVTGDELGSLHYPDQIMAFPVRETDDNKDLLTSWAATHKFFVVPINIAVQPAKDRIPESFSLTVTFPGIGALTRQPIVIDCFPKTGFDAAAFSGSAELKLDGDLKFAPGPVGSVGSSVNAALAYKYAPNYANVVSGNGSGSAFWQFTRTQTNYPVGELSLKLVVAVPIQMVTAGMNMTADARIGYSGRWWATGTTITSFRSHVSYPE